MNTREISNAFAVVDDCGRHRIVREYTRSLDPETRQTEYELAINGTPITRLTDNEFIVPESKMRLYLALA